MPLVKPRPTCYHYRVQMVSSGVVRSRPHRIVNRAQRGQTTKVARIARSVDSWQSARAAVQSARNCRNLMARSDLLINLVKAGTLGDQPLFRKTVEAVIAEERGKNHTVLADRLADAASPARNNGHSKHQPTLFPVSAGIANELFFETTPQRPWKTWFFRKPPAMPAASLSKSSTATPSYARTTSSPEIACSSLASRATARRRSPSPSPTH